MKCSNCDKNCRKERLVNGLQYCRDCDPQKKEKKNAYMKQYIKKRTQEDPEFHEQRKEFCRNYTLRKYYENKELLKSLRATSQDA